MIRAIESAWVETRFREMPFIAFIFVLTMSLKLAHAQIGLTFQISDPAPRIFGCKPERHRRVHCIGFVGRGGAHLLGFNKVQQRCRWHAKFLNHLCVVPRSIGIKCVA